jgi:hypothetical protein
VKGGPIMAVDSVGRLAVAPGHRAQVAPLVHEQGRAAAVGDAVTQANMADERDRGEAGPVSAVGCRRERKGEKPGGGGAPTRGPGRHNAGRRGSSSV